MITKRTKPLTDCGLPAFTFAGFPFPRYLATLERGSVRQRLTYRKASVCGNIYHAPAPNNRDGRGFYLTVNDAHGLRWAWADDVSGSRIKHTGWFCDGYHDEKIRGLVMRLPKRRGFLAGWSMGEGMASSVEYSPIFDNEIEAAHYADSIAESAAQSELEYQETLETEGEDDA